MSGEPSSFAVLLERLRRRDPVAAERVFRRFAGQLLTLAHQRLDARLRQKVDPDDIVQSVFGTVFRRLAEGQFTLENWDSLWGLLVRITVRKCGAWVDYFTTQGRDVAREVPLSSLDDKALSGWQFLDREPTPEEAAVLGDLVEQALRGLGDRERRIAALYLQGESVRKIAGRMRCSETKVYRVKRFVLGRLERLREREDR